MSISMQHLGVTSVVKMGRQVPLLLTKVGLAGRAGVLDCMESTSWKQFASLIV